MASQTTFGVIGLSARQPWTVPGNSHVFGFIQRQYSRQGLQQFGTQRDIAVMPALAVLNVDEHGLAVDVFDLKVAHLAVPHAGGIEHHQHGAVHEVARRIDQSLDFLDGQDYGQPARDLRVRDVVQRQAPLQRLDEEETKCTDMQPGVRGWSFRSLSRYA